MKYFFLNHSLTEYATKIDYEIPCNCLYAMRRHIVI